MEGSDSPYGNPVRFEWRRFHVRLHLWPRIDVDVHFIEFEIEIALYFSNM